MCQENFNRCIWMLYVTKPLGSEDCILISVSKFNNFLLAQFIQY
jgi:hypothetical protein